MKTYAQIKSEGRYLCGDDANLDGDHVPDLVVLQAVREAVAPAWTEVPGSQFPDVSSHEKFLEAQTPTIKSLKSPIHRHHNSSLTTRPQLIHESRLTRSYEMTF